MNPLHTLYFSTGGLDQRTAVHIQCHATSRHYCVTVAGGPLDAPEHLPAGCCDSTSTRGFFGEALPAVTLAPRDTEE